MNTRPANNATRFIFLLTQALLFIELFSEFTLANSLPAINKKPGNLRDNYQPDLNERQLSSAALAPANNILYVIIDDLGADFTPPNILSRSPLYNLYTPIRQKLAPFVMFNQAYTQISVCAPSRASFLYGRLPDNIELYNFWSEPREKNPQVLTTMGVFKRAGYNVQVTGKTFHNAVNPLLYINELSAQPTLTDSANNECLGNRMYCAMPVNKMLDYKIVSRVIDLIQQHQASPNNKQPFFFTAGLHRGHYPHIIPAEIFSRIPRNYVASTVASLSRAQFSAAWNSNISAPSLPFDFAPQMFDSPNNYLRSLAYFSGSKTGIAKVQNNRRWVPLTSLGDISLIYKNQKLTRTLARYQLGSAIGVLNQITRLLDFVDRSIYANNTIIVIHSDHGLSRFPKNNILSKNNLFDDTARVPLMFKVPGIAGGINNNPVELVHVRATLCSLTGVSCSDNANNLPMDSVSLVPGIINTKIAPVQFAVTQYQRCMPIGSIQSDNCMNPLTKNGANNKPAAFYSNMTYAITQKINGIMYRLAASYPYLTTYSSYGPIPTSPFAPYMQLYNTVLTWRLDYDRTGPISNQGRALLFMYEYTAEAGGKNLLFSQSSDQAIIRDNMLASLDQRVSKYAVNNRLR